MLLFVLQLEVRNVGYQWSNEMAVTRIKPLYDRAGKLKGYVDKYTGEEFGFPVIVGRKRNPYGKGWVMNSQEALEIVAKDKEIKCNDLKL